MPELKVESDEPYYTMLQSLKPVAEHVMEDELDFDTYKSTGGSRSPT